MPRSEHPFLMIGNWSCFWKIRSLALRLNLQDHCNQLKKDFLRSYYMPWPMLGAIDTKKEMKQFLSSRSINSVRRHAHASFLLRCSFSYLSILASKSMESQVFEKRWGKNGGSGFWEKSRKVTNHRTCKKWGNLEVIKTLQNKLHVPSLKN